MPTRLLLLLLLSTRVVLAGPTTRVSVGPGGVQANGPSAGPSVSGDGRFVVFYSDASNLVAGDTNGVGDIFVHDLATGVTERVSIGAGGVQTHSSNGQLYYAHPAISADGRFVAFVSVADDLVPDDTNLAEDVFVHDRLTGVTSRVSVGPGGIEGNGASGGAYGRVTISADGRYVAFVSEADNLVADDTNGIPDAFVHDRQTGVTTRVSVATGGAEVHAGPSGEFGAAAISADGRFVGFASASADLVPDDTNGRTDIFLHDRDTTTTVRVNVSGTGTEVDPNHQTFEYTSVSGNGRYVVFSSSAINLNPGDPADDVDAFVRDTVAGTTGLTLLDSEGRKRSTNVYEPNISADGRFVAFYGSGIDEDFVVGDRNGVEPDVYVRDLLLGTTTRASVDSAGHQGNAGSYDNAVSADGAVVAFRSEATNLVADDTNGMDDIFVHERTCGNGVVEADEQCDDGNAVRGDGCEPDCTPTNPLCPSGGLFENATLTLKGLGRSAGSQAVRLAGRTYYHAVFGARLFPFSGPAEGAQLLIEDLGSGGQTLFELSSRTTPVPDDAASCGANDGWIVAGRSQVYRNRSNAVDAPACTPGSAGGLQSLRTVQLNVSGVTEPKIRQFSVNASVHRANIPAATGPLRATIVFGASAADAAAGECATRPFGSGDCSRRGSTLTCRFPAKR
jgi:cysteine-rich repeat protein